MIASAPAQDYPHLASVTPDGSFPGGGIGDDDEDEEHGFDPLPLDADDSLLVAIPVNELTPEGTSVPLSRSSSKIKRSRDDGSTKDAPEGNAVAAGDVPATAGTTVASAGTGELQPDIATSSGHEKTKKESVTTALTHALQADAEVTIEEYRRQLEAYMFNHHLGEPASAPNVQYDGEPSDLDDDDDEPRYHSFARTGAGGGAAAAPRRQARRGSRNSRGGVDRTVSGCSFMSTDTHLSTNLSIFSNMSILSENTYPTSAGGGGAAALGSGARERKMNMARSVGSNLSLMSDVTDISNTLDDLRL
jgi:hypothetical protein